MKCMRKLFAIAVFSFLFSSGVQAGIYGSDFQVFVPTVDGKDFMHL